MDYIHDGCTEPGYISAVPGLHGELRFILRRAVRWQIDQARREAAPLNPREADARWAKFLHAQLLSWELRDQKGELAPLTASNVARLNPGLYDALLGIVTSIRPSDPDPDAPADAPSMTTEGEDVGNSSRA